MSRLRLLARNVSSGYLQLAANAVYTLVSIPLALHYLPKQEFGLWALVTQIGAYLMVIDAGITGASVRFLIDHKDNPSDRAYGSVFKTGSVVLSIQGLIIAALAFAAGCVPGLLEVPPALARPFFLLLLGHGVVTGVSFFVRMYGSVLNAHQRHDIVNHAATAGFVVNLSVLWLGFHFGLGIFSLLAAYAASSLLASAIYVIAAIKLRLLPSPEARGQYDRGIFKELFRFANDLLLLMIGAHLISVGQIVIITRTLGLEAAAVWTVAIKVYSLAQQIIWKLWDYSANAISEMIVRGERERWQRRFQELFVFTASASVLGGIAIAACNRDFLAVWTNHRISWNRVNDLFLAALFFVTSTTRLHVGLTGQTKRIRGMRYVYFMEAITFVLLGFLLAPRWGIPAVLGCAIVMNILCTGVYGTHRTAEEYGLPASTIAAWMLPALRLALVLSPLIFAVWWFTNGLDSLPRLLINATVVAVAGSVTFWKWGITPGLRTELQAAATKVFNRLGLAAR